MHVTWLGGSGNRLTPAGASSRVRKRIDNCIHLEFASRIPSTHSIMSCLYGRQKGKIHLDEKFPSSDVDLHDPDVEIKIDYPPGVDGDADADEMRRRLEKLRSEILDAKLEW
jgi:hypothetical protein